MRRPSPFTLLVVFAAVATLSSAAHAQGYFAGSKGARVAGRAGAFVAKADDLSAVELNPAGLAKMPGWTFHLSNRFSYNSVSYQRDPTINTAAGAGPDPVPFAPVENGTPLQGVDPLLGVAYGVGDWGFALSAYAPPGIARLSFPIDGGQRYMMVSRDAEILTYAASVAYKYKDVFGVGATAQWVHVPKLQYSLVVDGFPGAAVNNISSQYDMLSTVSGSDPFTFAAVLGGWVKPTPFLEFGLSGQVVPAHIQANSTLAIDPLSASFSDGYVELTRGPYMTPANDVRLYLPLPMIGRFGARYIGEMFDIEFDATYQTWSRVQDFILYSNGLVGTLYDMVGGVPYPVDTIDVGDVVIEKRWHDSFTLALGSDVRVIEDKLTVRGGFGFESSVASPAYANVDFATGHHINAAVGGSLYLGQFEVALAYALRHQLPLYISEADGQVFQEKPGSLEPPPVVNAGSYYATSHFLSLDVLLRLQ